MSERRIRGPEVREPIDPRTLDDLRAAYYGIPTGEPTSEQVADAMPRLVEAVGVLLRQTGRVCDVCGDDHSRQTSEDVAHEDFAAILRALNLGDHARPTSRHAIVHDEILPAIRGLSPSEGSGTE